MVTRGKAWTEAEDGKLRTLVSRLGRNWVAVREVWRGRRCSAKALGKRYAVLVARRRATRPSVRGGARESETVAAAPTERSEAGRREQLAQAASEVARQDARPFRPAPLRLEPSAVLAHRRSLSHKRAWSASIRTASDTSGQEPREAAPRESHRRLITALQLTHAAEPHDILFCDLVRAERRWEAELRRQGAKGTRAAVIKLAHARILPIKDRDEWGLVQYPCSPLPTLLACRHRSCWVGGQRMGAGRYVRACEVARWLGLGREAMAVQASLVRPSALWVALASAIAKPFLMAQVAAAGSLIKGGWPALPFPHGSLYSGAFDSHLGALRRAGLHPTASLVADSNRRRLDAVVDLLEPEEAFSSAEEAACSGSAQLFSLDWTPPCELASMGGRLGPRHTRAARRLKAKAWARRTARELLIAVRRLSPRVLLGEFVPTLRSLRRGSQALVFRRAMARLPYRWYWGVRDAAQLGSPSHRRRLALVAVRLDWAAERHGRRANVGGWWRCGECGTPRSSHRTGERLVCGGCGAVGAQRP